MILFDLMDKSKQTPIEPLLRAKEVAQIIGCDPDVIYKWISKGTGPKHYKINRRVTRFRLADILDWLKTKER